MNKEEFLKSLTEEQLGLLGNITHTNIINELNNRKSKKVVDVKIGDCFIYRNDYDDIYLTKVMSSNPDDPNWDFDCEEISIDDHDIDIYEVNYYIDDFNEHDRIDSEIFNKITTLVNDRDNALDKINKEFDKISKEFDKQIRELCLTLLNIPNKN